MKKPRPKEYFKAYYAAHREKAVAYAREYRLTHREDIAKRRAAERAANPEKNAARCRAYYAKNRDQLRAKFAVYQATHKDTIAPRVAANLRAWLAANPGRGAAYMNARRVLKRGNGGSHTPAEWRAKCAEFGNRCAYCDQARRLTRDHDMPLSRGGSDNIENILPACRPCNSRKNNKTATEFLGLVEAAA